ncbi:hypothetical protein NITMOv2_1364 [Nitrospira moscoviensis]|uniref:Uncharacterized protein n=1 Tax=Nitrospira moscoviensis TaxID=42253 RepID=A0A0K2GB26_NITMO|nr:hypothetical protein NITMOv2_1364 [Nitrospira moscoviensis]
MAPLISQQQENSDVLKVSIVSSGENMEAIDSIKRIWEANGVLWHRRVVPLILEPLEKRGGLDTSGLWDHVLATAFGRSQKTFESIQLLCDPALPRRFWDDAFVLTRSHAYSDPSRPLIPTQVGHPFRRNAATDSDRKSATVSSLLGIGGRHPSE